MYMYGSYDHAMVRWTTRTVPVFAVILIHTQVTSYPMTYIRSRKLMHMNHMIVLYCIDDLRQDCCENQDLTSVTPFGSRLTINP